jgi:lipopolysaccharide biosynthesis glycosyltransferase
MLNFLFSFDSNYEIQGSVAIYSLLENVKEKINIFVIVDNSTKLFKLPAKVTSHKNLHDLKYKLIEPSDIFYNTEQAHISKATFYRLYLSSLFENENFNLIYLDADIVCVQDPTKELTSAIREMKINNQNAAFADELYRNQYEDPFTRLGMSSDKYFNAGVMIINLAKWKENEYSTKSIKLIETLKEKAKYWDQDVLNSLFDGNYLSLDNNLNYRTGYAEQKIPIEKKIFIHFSGKSKPWDVGGIFEEFAELYHYYYKNLYRREYHVTTRNRKNAILKLYRNRKYFGLLNYKKLLKYIIISISSIIKK